MQGGNFKSVTYWHYFYCVQMVDVNMSAQPSDISDDALIGFHNLFYIVINIIGLLFII